MSEQLQVVQETQEIIAPSGAPSVPEAEAPAETVTPQPEAAPGPSPEDQARSRIQRQRDAANRRYGQEKARADFLAVEVEKLRPKPPEVAPKLENFTDVEDFTTAVKREALKEFEQKQQQERNSNAVRSIKAEWEGKVAEAEDKYDDFNDVVGVIEPTTPLSAAVMRAGPDVAYHLGSHLVEARKLAAMDPIDQIFNLGKLAARLESAPAVAKQPSKAPAPITPVSGKASASSSEITDDDDMATFIRKRNKQLGRK